MDQTKDQLAADYSDNRYLQCLWCNQRGYKRCLQQVEKQTRTSIAADQSASLNVELWGFCPAARSLHFSLFHSGVSPPHWASELPLQAGDKHVNMLISGSSLGWLVSGASAGHMMNCTQCLVLGCFLLQLCVCVCVTWWYLSSLSD